MMFFLMIPVTKSLLENSGKAFSLRKKEYTSMVQALYSSSHFNHDHNPGNYIILEEEAKITKVMSASGGTTEPKTGSAYPRLKEQIPFHSIRDNFVMVTQILLVAQ